MIYELGIQSSNTNYNIFLYELNIQYFEKKKLRDKELKEIGSGIKNKGLRMMLNNCNYK